MSRSGNSQLRERAFWGLFCCGTLLTGSPPGTMAEHLSDAHGITVKRTNVY